MPVEGRDLSSRQTQYVVKDLEIGQPINSANVQSCRRRRTRKREVLSERSYGAGGGGHGTFIVHTN